MSGVLAALGGGGRAAGSINQSAGWPSAASAGGASINVNNDGTFTGSGSGGGNWVTPTNAAVAALYEIRVDATAGSFSTGTTGSWLDLGTTRSWSRNAGSDVTFTLSIREKGSGVVRVTLVGEVLDAT
jgi:hypothetical protein